jgi:hypothetical protein
MRIDVTRLHGESVVLVAGWLHGDAVDELAKACREIGGPVALDLTELVASDASGIELLRVLQAKGVEMRGLSPYLQLLLDGEPR